MYLLSHGNLYHLLKMVFAGFSAIKWSVLLLWKLINIFIYSPSPQHTIDTEGSPSIQAVKMWKSIHLRSLYLQSVQKDRDEKMDHKREIAATGHQKHRTLENGKPKTFCDVLDLVTCSYGVAPVLESAPPSPSTSNFCIRKQAFCLLFSW